MFNEDADWSDDGESQANKATAKEPQTENSTTKLKTKCVGKKSLLRTLQTLGSVPEWKNEDHQEDSDSEVEAAPAPVKKKKRRKKRRRHAETSGEQGENGDAEESVQEETSAPPKKKKDAKPGTPKAKSASAAKTEEKEIPDSDQPNANKPEDADRLSRQQWKNKMKNRRKCKNRYRQNQPEGGANGAADKQEPKEVVEMDSDRKDGSEKTTQVTSKKEKKVKTQKTEKPTQNFKKQLTVNKGNANISDVGKRASESAVDGSKQKPPESKAEILTDCQQSSTIRQKAEQSKAQSLKRERLRKLLQGQKTAPQESPAEQGDEPVEPEGPGGPEGAEEAKPSEASCFRARMEQRLDAARFRYINEVLYSTSSGEAKRMFRQDPQAFWVYHKGYTAQVQRWPANPVDSIIAYIQKRAPSLVVADFGCGDCKIARSVKNKVHSFDLAATCELVTVCDMAHVPLEDGSVDIAVFCLSLMGTNLVDFLSEANRVLKNGGVLKIAEVASRFDNVRNFITALARLGFKMASKDTENTHFYSFEFEKTGNVSGSGKKLGLQLKPCLYKKR